MANIVEDFFTALSKGAQNVMDTLNGKKDQGAEQAPSLLDSITNAWTGFLNQVNEDTKQKIQSGNYSVNPTPQVLDMPFSKPDNLAQRATAQIKQSTPKEPEPWKFDTPFGDKQADNLFQQAVRELDAADPEMKSKNIFKDAYDITSGFVRDVFASDAVVPLDSKVNPFDVAEGEWRKALDAKIGEYSAVGKGAEELAKMLEEGGYETEKQHREKQNQGIIAAAQEMRNKENPYYQIMQLTAGEPTAENMQAVGQALNALGDEGRQMMEYMQRMNMTDAQAMDFIRGQAEQRYQPAQMTFDEADRLMNERYPMYGLAKDTQGSMDDYSAAYGDVRAIGRKAARGEELTDAEEQAWYQAVQEVPWLGEWRMNLDGQGNSRDVAYMMTPEQQAELEAYGRTKAQQIADVAGMYTPYAVSPKNQAIWEAYTRTPEGAAQWAEDAQGTKDAQKAKDNLWFVERKSKYDEVASRPDFAETSKAKEDFHSGNDGFDQKYNVINNIGGAGDRAGLLADIGGSSSYAVSLYHFMTPEEKGVFNSYANSGAIDAANEYLDFLSYDINKRMTQEGTERMQAMSESGVGGALVGSAVSVPMSLARGVGYLDQLGQNVAQLFTGRPVDRNSQANMIGKLADSAREGVQNQVDWNVNILGQDVDVFDFLYGTAMSGIDSFTAGQLGAALGGIANSAEKAQKLASWTGAAILGGGAAQSAMQEAYDRGANDGTALLMGVIAGANETLFEKKSIGNLIKHGQDVGKKTFAEEIKNAFIEAGVNASEEFNTSVANGIAEYFLNHDDREVQKKADEYERLGLSPEAALEKARGEFWASAVMDAAGGALMGGVFGSVENVQNRQNVNRVDKAVGNGFSSESLDTLYSLAESEGASDKAKKLARKFPKEKANAKQMGELFRELSNTMGAGIREALHNMGVADIALQIGQETGTVDRAAAEAVTAMMQGENLSGEQVAALAANPAAMKIVDALFKPEAGDGVTSSAADAAPSPQGEGLEPVQFEPMPGMEEAEAKRRQAAEATQIQPLPQGQTAGQRAPKTPAKPPIRMKGKEGQYTIEELKQDGTEVRIRTSGGEEISLEDADVDAGEAAVIQNAAGMENQDEAAAMIAAWQNGPRLRHQDAGPAQNRSTSPETQTEAEAEPAGQGAVMSPDKETARADEARQAQDFAMGFRAVYEAAQTGKTADGTQSIYADMLAPEARQAAEEAGRQAYEQAEAQAEERNAQEAQAAGYRTVKNAGADAVGVLFDRVRDGIKKGGERVNAMLQMLDRVGREFGMQYRVVDKLENDANGKYVHGTNIVYLSLDAEEGAITKAASHEGFHFISAFSPEMKKTITDFVMDKLGKVEGYDIQQRIKEVQQQYRDQAGQELTPEAATEEIVADSMLDVIGTRENMEQLMKQSKSTAEKIKEWITNTYQKFKDILNRLAGYSPEVAALKDDVDYLGRISSMWQEGMRQAAEAWRQAQVGYNDGSAALEQSQAVQQYRQEMQTDQNVEDRESSLTAFLSQLFMDTQKPWLEQHMDEYEEGLAKYRQALLEYKRGGVALNVALERAGLNQIAGNDIRVASYAADQALTLEGAKERAKEKAAGVKYSFKGRDGKDLTVSDEELNKNKDEVANMEAIASVVGNAFPKTEGEKLADRLDNYFKSIGGSVYNEEFGEILLGRDGAEHFEARVNPKAAAAIPLIVDVIKKGKLVDVDPNHANKGFPSISLAATIEIDHKPYFMGVSIRQIKYGDNRYYMHNVVAEDIETLNKNGGNSVKQIRAAQSVGDRTAENPHYLYNILQEIAKRKQNLKNSEKNNSVSSYSLPTQPRQETDAAEWVRDDAELYAQLKQDPDARAALWMIERIYRNTTTGEGRTVLSEADLKKRLPEVVKRLKEQTGATVSVKEMTKQIMTLWEALQKPGYQMGEMMHYARDMIKRWIESAPGVMAEQDETTKEILQELKHPFSLTPDMKSEIKGTFGDARDFYRKNIGKMRIKNDAKSTLADVWMETLNKKNPGVFTADATEADMPIILDAWLETAGRREYSGDFGANIGAMSTDLAMNTILELFNTPDILQTRYEMNKAQVDRTYQLYQAAERLVATVREGYKQKYDEKIHRYRDTRDKQAKRDSIARSLRAINSMTVKPTDRRHVPMELKEMAEQALDALLNGKSGFSKEKLTMLENEYRKLEGRKGSLAGWEQETLERIEWLAENLDGKSLKELSLEELEELGKLVGNLHHMMIDQNKAFIEGREVDIDQYNEQFDIDMKKKGEANKDKAVSAAREFRLKNTTPVYFADQAGGVIKSLINNLFHGQRTAYRVAKKGHDLLGVLENNYHVNNWINDKTVKEITTEQGHKIKLDRRLALELAALWNREINSGDTKSHHLRIGGFTYKQSAADRLKMDTTTAHRLTNGDMAQITAWLGKEQMGFMNAVVSMLSNEIGAEGNKVSLRLHGYEKFGEKNYYPYATDKRFTSTELTNTDEREGQPKNESFTKALTRYAMTPVAAGDFMDTVTGHINDMAIYCGFAETADVANRLMNRRVMGMDAETGEILDAESNWVKMEKAMGKEAVSYLRTLFKDVGGGINAGERSPIGKGLSMFKKASVSGNLSVWIQQPFAYLRAGAMVSPGYLTQALNPVKLGGYIDRMYKHSEVAGIKKIGKFDTGTGKSMAQWIGESVKDPSKYKRVMNALDEKVFGIGAEKADEWAWGFLWGAIEKEITHTTGLKYGSAEYWEAVSDRFEDVVNHTQVYDSVLSKSEYMRSKNEALMMATSFMAEPTLSANMLTDSIVRFKEKGMGAKQVARNAGTFLFTALLTALAKSIPGAWRRKKDEGRTFGEKWLAEAVENFTYDISPAGLAGMIPFARDVISLFEGYDVARSDMDAVEQIVKAMQTLTNDKATLEDKIQNSVGAVANLFGVPMKNVWRDVEGIIRNLAFGESASESRSSAAARYTILDSLNLEPFGLWDKEAAAYYDRMAQAMIKGDMNQYMELREYMEGTRQTNPKTIDNGLKNRIYSAVDKGLLGEKKAIEMLGEFFDMKEDTAFYAIDKYREGQEHKDEEEWEYNKLGNVMEAVIAGKEIPKEEKQKLLDHGYTELELVQAIETEIGKLYKDGDVTKAEAEKMLRRYADMKDADEIYFDFDKWDYQKQQTRDDPNYSKYVDLDTAIRKGKSTDAAIKELTDHGFEMNTIRSHMKDTIGDMYMDGTLNKAQAKEKLKKVAGIEDTYTLFWAFDKWDYEMKYAADRNAPSWNMWRYLKAAMETGDPGQVRKVVQEIYVANDTWKDTISSGVTSNYKSLFLELTNSGKKTEAANLQALMLTAYEAAGYKRDSKLKTMQNWIKDQNKEKKEHVKDQD